MSARTAFLGLVHRIGSPQQAIQATTTWSLHLTPRKRGHNPFILGNDLIFKASWRLQVRVDSDNDKPQRAHAHTNVQLVGTTRVCHNSLLLVRRLLEAS